MPERARLYPRLNDWLADSIWHEISGLPVSQLAERARTRHEHAVFAETGPARIQESELGSLRTALEEIALELGYPDSDLSRENRRSFDASMARRLYREMPVMPGEASRDEVWSFLTLVLVPDLARWRFPSAGKDRFVGGVRNTLQRLWWRAFTLEESSVNDPLHLLDDMPEDALVQLMERPGVSSNRRLARLYAQVARELERHLGYQRAEDLWRIMMRRFRQLVPILELEAVEYASLKGTVIDLLKEIVAADNRRHTKEGDDLG